MIAMRPFIESMMDRPGEPEPLPGYGDLDKNCASPAGAEVGTRIGKDGVPAIKQNSEGPGVKWDSSFGKGAMMQQSPKLASKYAPPSTVDGPSKDDPNKFLR